MHGNAPAALAELTLDLERPFIPWECSLPLPSPFPSLPQPVLRPPFLWIMHWVASFSWDKKNENVLAKVWFTKPVQTKSPTIQTGLYIYSLLGIMVKPKSYKQWSSFKT